MRLFLLSLTMALLVNGADLKTGDALPELKGEYLTGKSAVLPGAAKGKFALLALGFPMIRAFRWRSG